MWLDLVYFEANPPYACVFLEVEALFLGYMGRLRFAGMIQDLAMARGWKALYQSWLAYASSPCSNQRSFLWRSDNSQWSRSLIERTAATNNKKYIDQLSLNPSSAALKRSTSYRHKEPKLPCFDYGENMGEGAAWLEAWACYFCFFCT